MLSQLSNNEDKTAIKDNVLDLLSRASNDRGIYRGASWNLEFALIS
jgi:hypothetical protein